MTVERKNKQRGQMVNAWFQEETVAEMDVEVAHRLLANPGGTPIPSRSDVLREAVEEYLVKLKKARLRP